MSAHDNPTDEQDREQQGAPQRRTGWHQVNTGHLVMGVAFLGLVVAWALLTSGTVDIEDHGWVMGVPWLVAGAVGLVASVLRGPRRHWAHDQWQHGHWKHGHWTHDHSEHGHGGHGGSDDHGSGSMHGWH